MTMERCNHTTTEGGVTMRCTEPAGHSGAHFGRRLNPIDRPDYADMGENPGLQEGWLIPLPDPKTFVGVDRGVPGGDWTPAQSAPQVVDALPVASLYKDELHMWRMRAAVALDIITDHDRPLSEAINALEHLIQNIDDKLRAI